MKIALNKCYGGFGVSRAVFEALGKEWDGYGHLGNEDFGIEGSLSTDYNAFRVHPDLIAAIEAVGVEKASGKLSLVVIVDIPDGMSWVIDDYDGMETVHERNRSW